MLEHCITFYNEADEPVYHCHVTADNEMMATEGALHLSVANNVNLSAATFMEVRLVIELPPGLVESTEALRAAMHAGKPAATPQGCHLH